MATRRKVPSLPSSLAIPLWHPLVAEPSMAPAGWGKGPFRPPNRGDFEAERRQFNNWHQPSYLEQGYVLNAISLVCGAAGGMRVPHVHGMVQARS